MLYNLITVLGLSDLHAALKSALLKAFCEKNTNWGQAEKLGRLQKTNKHQNSSALYHALLNISKFLRISYCLIICFENELLVKWTFLALTKQETLWYEDLCVKSPKRVVLPAVQM